MAHVKGPWYWVKYPKTKTIRMMGEKQLIVMDFVRWGMQSAQPRLIQVIPGRMELMIAAESLDLDKDPNARLIAASPDLLAACKSAIEALIVPGDVGNFVPDAIRVLSEAIAKAEGAQ